MLERDIEAYLRKRVEASGGLCPKWSSPQCNGVPDRIVLLNRQVWFVEVKSSTGKMSALQEAFAVKLITAGFNYRLVNSKEKVDELLKEILCKK